MSNYRNGLEELDFFSTPTQWEFDQRLEAYVLTLEIRIWKHLEEAFRYVELRFIRPRAALICPINHNQSEDRNANTRSASLES